MMVRSLQECLQLLAAAAEGCGREKEARWIREADPGRQHLLVDLLTRIERTPGLEPELWNPVVLFKACLGGRQKEEEFVRACLRAQGLV
jgi:hypothetical protein